jgi:hypothetical protein
MIFITRKHISRRTLLRGVGASLALPFLDAMHPAMTAESRTAASPVRRLLVVEYPHGVVNDTWNPVGEGANYKISESLAPLERHRDRLLIIRGLTSSPDRSKADFHDRAIASFLTGCEPSSGHVQVGVSMDQVAAKHLGDTTQFASLELGTEDPIEEGGPCYRDATTNLPLEINPRFLFERMFGDTNTSDPATRSRQSRDDASILDAATQRISELNRRLGPPDKRKLDQYFESIRDVERRMAVAAHQTAVNVSGVARPPGIPDSWPDHVKLMFDLQLLALQSDMTRVITFVTAMEASPRAFTHLNLTMSFHEISHHNNEKTKLDALSKINRNHSELLAYYLDKLDAAHEASGSILDQTVLLYGSTLSNPSLHSQRDLPIVIAGGAALGVKGGRYIRVTGDGDGPPLTNLHLALLGKIGVETNKLGDSTGALDCLEA